MVYIQWESDRTNIGGYSIQNSFFQVTECHQAVTSTWQAVTRSRLLCLVWGSLIGPLPGRSISNRWSLSGPTPPGQGPVIDRL